MPKAAVIDISHHQIVQSLEEVKEEGIVGVIHKLTEGTSFVDKKVSARFHLAQEAGLKWGLYHFLRPGNMRAQAEHFINTARAKGMLGPEVMLAADHEDRGVSLADLVNFLHAVESLSNRSPVIYSGHVLKEQLGTKGDSRLKPYRLWLAQYSSKPKLPAGFDKHWLWQYTEDGQVPGITPPTDLNACWEDDIPALLATWSGTYEEPEIIEGPVEGPVEPPVEEPDVTMNVTISITAKGKPPITMSWSVPLASIPTIKKG
jgi:lysozyme